MRAFALLLLLALLCAGCGGREIVGPPGHGFGTEVARRVLDNWDDPSKRAADNDGGVLAKKIEPARVPVEAGGGAKSLGDPTGDD